MTREQRAPKKVVRPPQRVDWTFHRALEAYRDRSRATGRLVVLTVIFAAVMVARVVEPFGELSRALVRREASVESLSRATVEAGATALGFARQEEALSEAARLLEEAPWRGVGQRLVDEVGGLRAAYQRLVDASPEELRRVMEQRFRSADGAGGALESSAVPASFRQGPRDGPWQAPPEPPLVPRGEQRAGPARTPEAQRALADYDRAVTRLRELGLPVPGQAAGSTGAASAPAELLPPAPRADLAALSEAVERLGVDPAQLVRTETRRQRDELLHQRLSERVGAAVDRALGELRALALDGVAASLARSAESAALAGDFPARAEAWLAARAGDGPWRAGLSDDPARAAELADSFEALVADLDARCAREAGIAAAHHAEAAARAEEVTQELVLVDAELEDIRCEREALVPGWIREASRDRFGSQELVQGLPYVLAALALVAARSAAASRRRWLTLRREAWWRDALGDVLNAVSPWTPARRDAGGMAVTLACFTACIAAVWVAFEYTTSLTQEWAALPRSDAWGLTVRSGDSLIWFGRALFLALAGCAVLAVLGEEEELVEPEAV